MDLLFTLQWAGLEQLVGYVVNDFSSLGIVEFKCPYTQHDSTPQEACTDPTFYCSLNNDGTMLLNQSHQYYYQVQLQLSSQLQTGVIFAFFMTKGVMVECILPDSAWIEFRIPQLETYFDEEIPPEVAWPWYKPSGGLGSLHIFHCSCWSYKETAM